MSKKDYWLISHNNEWAILRCPICFEWYQIPNTPGEIGCYHFCPWCGKPLFVKEENKDGLSSRN